MGRARKANNRGMVAHMHSNAELAVHVGERAVAEAVSAVAAEPVELLMQNTQAELPPAAQHDARLGPARGVLMDKGAEPHEFDQRERLWNRELRQEAEWDDGSRQGGGVAACDGPHDADAAAPVVAHASAPSDEVLPEPDAAAARVVAPASGTGASTGSAGVSTAVPAVAAACAPAVAAAVAPWHYDGNGAASAGAIEAAVSADAEAPAASTPIDVTEDAMPLSAMHIPRTMPPPPPFLEQSTDAAAPAGAIQPPPEIIPPIHILDGRVEARPELDRDLICSPEDGADEQRLRGVQSTLPTPQPMTGRRVHGSAPTWIRWLTSGFGMDNLESDSTRTV